MKSNNELRKAFPLYSLVWVNHEQAPVEGGRYQDIGQVLSMPTPERTLMIRRVPGHPGTLEEIAIDRLNPYLCDPRRLKRMRHVHYATVAGPGQFPTDMFRYDRCTAVNFELVERDRFSGGFTARIKAPNHTALINHMLPEADLIGGDEELIVARVSDRADPGWTAERWRSFLWRLTPLKSERFEERP